MSSTNTRNPQPSWLKDILNGFIAWIIAYILYMIPAFAVGTSMGFDLGPKLHDNAEVSRRISQAIGEMFHTNLYLRYGYILVLGGLVFWRSRNVTKRFAEISILHGVIVGCTAAVLVAVQMLPFGAGVFTLMPVAVCVVAGYFGGRKHG